MYRIGELAKLADVTPDTIRYYEKQQMMDHDVRTEEDFVFTRITIFSGCALFAMPVSWVSLWKRSANYCRSASIRSIIPVRSRKGSFRRD
jgi:hypothetical protein